MKYTSLGSTQMQVSRLCLGAMNFGWSTPEAEALKILSTAYEAGINFIDTADIYSTWVSDNTGGESEAIIGKWLQSHDRSKVIIATKVRGRMWDGPDGEGLGKAHITRAVEDSLRRLNTDYIDVYQAHWFDEETPLEETLETFNALVQSGKVRAIGCSNHTAAQLAEALRISEENSWAHYAVLQPHYSMLHRQEFEAELAALCQRENIGVIPYSPLAAGFLTGKYMRDNRTPESQRGSDKLIKYANDERAFDVLDVLRDIANEHNEPMTHIALAWQLANPVITAPIVGIRTIEQLLVSLGAVNITLTQAQINLLNEVSAVF